MTKTKGAMKYLFIMLVLTVFAAGVGIGGLIGLQLPTKDAISFETQTTSSRGLQFNSVQLADAKAEVQPLKSAVQAQTLEGPVERNSPSDWIKESQIEMRPDGVFIHFNNPQWAILADTNSMDPVFDAGSHLIQIIPQSQNDIKVGDIVSYASPLGFSIVHRVIEIGNDEEGWYAILKGDNNPQPDPWKVRFDMVRRVTIMVVY
ncbi:MAG: signal peptidase I [Candidatus Woesearchaeota archaeon]